MLEDGHRERKKESKVLRYLQEGKVELLLLRETWFTVMTVV